MSTIEKAVHHTIRVGAPGYGSPLTIAATGDIAPTRYGAAGIYSAVASAKLTNNGTITGAEGNKYTIRQGGTGVDLAAAGTLINHEHIAGGVSNLFGGTGVELAHGGTLSNSGTITGGSGIYFNEYRGQGGTGVILAAGGTLHNTGTIAGGHGYYGDVGIGLQLAAAATISNSGTIVGGILAEAGAITNAGLISGGYGIGALAGIGVDLTAGGTLNNHGIITGGRNYETLIGSDGVALAAGGTARNSFLIQGGAGFNNPFDSGFAGGAGLSLAGGATITNTGTIIGGAGGYGTAKPGGNGGAGVRLSFGTLVNGSKIAGGAGGDGSTSGAHGVAVYVDPASAGPDVIVADPGAVFAGGIAGNNADVTLELAGAAPGTLAGIGSQITGIPFITEAAGAIWTLTGTTSLAAHQVLGAAGALTFAGTVSGAGTLMIDPHGTVTAAAALNIAHIVFGAAGGGALALGDPTAVTGTLAGFAGSDMIDLKSLAADALNFANGTLTLLDGGSAVDALHFAGHYTSSNFYLTSDKAGGTTINYAATQPPADLGCSLPLILEWK